MLKFQGEWGFWIKKPQNRSFDKVGATSMTNWDQFWTIFEQLTPINTLEIGSKMGLFKGDRKPFIKGPIDQTSGRWVCHLNDIGDLGLVPRLVWETLIVKLVTGNWINKKGDYPVKFLGKVKDETQYDLIYTNEQLNSMMLKDIDGIVIEKRYENEFILSIWNRHDCLSSHLPTTVPKNSYDKPFDYEITRYERPFNNKFDMFKQTGLTFANYRRRIFGGVEGILLICKALLIELNIDIAPWDEVDLIFKCRYVFHKRVRRTTSTFIEYPDDGLVVEEIINV